MNEETEMFMGEQTVEPDGEIVPEVATPKVGSTLLSFKVLIVIECLFALNTSARDIFINNDHWQNTPLIVFPMIIKTIIISLMIIIVRKNSRNLYVFLAIMYVFMQSSVGLYFNNMGPYISINLDVFFISQMIVSLYLVGELYLAGCIKHHL